ncbi:putative dihydrofolate reductase [Diplodia seriata]|uniref:Dihydrofolate reductase n=1 Tax=Diplodia seriata TaxID=420778 RepID=A0A0G2GIG9_9PEZI|nr:putative dihydrofolate reductase [Diplodia seriata]
MTTEENASSAATMASSSSSKKIPLTLIVAATPSLGIGKNGTLPWPQLKKEMGYFARVTKRVVVPASTTITTTATSTIRRNAVVMGRKTWESIPPRFRPLRDRVNVVVSRDPARIPGIPPTPPTAIDAPAAGEGSDPAAAPIAASSLPDALEKLGLLQKRGALGRVFVIGGAQLYEAALKLDEAESVLLTRVWREYECDTVFPVDVVGSEGKGGSGWVRRENGGDGGLSEFVGEEVAEGRVKEVVKGKEGEADDQVEFEFCLFERA